MRRLHLSTLLLALILAPLSLRAEEPTDQISLSIDAVGQGFYFFNGQNKPADPQWGLGGSAFLDYRFLKVLSLGFGTDYLFSPDNKSISLMSVDAAGRIFPMVLDGGEVYLQGGVGYNVNNGIRTHGHFHGYAGLGYRHFLDKGLALDMGLQYDFWSPILAPSSGVGAKLGLTFLFGKDRWPSDITHKIPLDLGKGSDQPGTYIWKPGDTLKKIAVRQLGAEGLYPAIVDVNPDLFAHVSLLKVGSEIRMPTGHFTDEELDKFSAEALSERYIRLYHVTAHLPYPHRPDWKGPKAYRWKVGDDMRSVASKLYDDEDLYPILVDANEEALIHPVNLVPGVVLKVPAPPSDEWLDYIHDEAWERGYYIWWKNVSDKDNP
ncbi:MAG TPA: hypothetical protein VHE12_07555 [bacterium]|nr:hypothetical protein [bacterium]